MNSHRSAGPASRLVATLALALPLYLMGCGGADDDGESTTTESALTMAAAEPSAVSARQAAQVALTDKEFEERKQRLLVQKRVDQWPTVAVTSGTLVEPLTASECTWLGGKVEYWAHCGTTLQKCVGSNGRETCITTK